MNHNSAICLTGSEQGKVVIQLYRQSRNGTEQKWFVEGDIKGCFDNIDHQILLSILQENIQDKPIHTVNI